MPPIVEVQSPNHWTAREFPFHFSLIFQYVTFYNVQIFLGVIAEVKVFHVLHILSQNQNLNMCGFLKINLFIFIFIYFWQHWVFIVCRLSLVAASRG